MKKLLLIFGVLIAAGVGIGLYRNAHRPQQTVIVYSSISKDFLKEVHRMFEAQHHGIKVQTILSTTTVLEDRIRSEKAGPLGDVMFGGDVTTYLQLKNHGLIQAVDLSMAMIAGAPMEFILGLPAQEFAAVEYYRRPSRSDFPRDKLPPEIRDPVKALPVDWLSIGDQGTLWLQKWNEEVWHKGGS